MLSFKSTTSMTFWSVDPRLKFWDIVWSSCYWRTHFSSFLAILPLFCSRVRSKCSSSSSALEVKQETKLFFFVEGRAARPFPMAQRVQISRGQWEAVRPTWDLWTEVSENFSDPQQAQSLHPIPPHTHCFSCASRSLTSASRLFTRATSSSSRSCSRRFWASVFCQSADKEARYPPAGPLHTLPPFPAFSSFLVFLHKPYYRTTSVL